LKSMLKKIDINYLKKSKIMMVKKKEYSKN